MNKTYVEQVKLLIRTLPLVAEQDCFALHGGTAINLFVREMPRLSVDIDLTFVPINPRAVALEKIRAALRQIKAKIISEIPRINVIGPEETGADVKLFCQYAGSQVKIEVNTVMRGLIEPVELRPLVPSATDFFQSFCEVKTVSTAQLYGGKLCAALDRQHPRDLFDVALFFDGGGEIETIKKGLIYALLCSNRPLHELLSPHPNNQEQAFNNQFKGMTQIPFTYQDFEMTRERMLEKIIKGLSSTDINFLVSFMEATPNWAHFDFAEYPAIQWKLLNIRKFKEESRIKFNEHLEKLKDIFAS